MATFLMSFVVITLVVLGMAVGVLCGRRALKGSCGGLTSIEGLDTASVLATADGGGKVPMSSECIGVGLGSWLRRS